MNIWVKRVIDSLPDHSNQLKNELDMVINKSPLDVVDTHAIALVSALASGNGELAMVIDELSVLAQNPAEVKAAKHVAPVASMVSIWDTFCDERGKEHLGTSINLYTVKNDIIDTVVSKKKYEMYMLAASSVNKWKSGIAFYYDSLKNQGMKPEDIAHVVAISAVISIIGKVAPDF